LMSLFAATLRRARESASLTVEAMARLVGLEAATIERLEAGADAPAFATLKRYAGIFGTRIDRFLEQGGSTSPSTLLFRSAAEHGADLGAVLSSDDLYLLGSFLASVADVDELERTLDEPPAIVPRLESADLTDPEWPQGQEFATRAREALGLGLDPIASMRALLEERLRWSLFFVTPDELSPGLQGASTIEPRPAILVNLVEGRESWWRTRVSLAHEMCHVLYDSRTTARPYLISPQGELQGRKEWAIVDRFRGLERRANAFAVHFLAPSAAIRMVVGGLAPDSERAIRAVCVAFGIGRTVAVRRLGHEHRLSEEAQNQRIERGSDTGHAKAHPDGAIEPGLRRGRLASLVDRALDAQKLGPVAARAILDVPLSEPLPGAGDGREPLLSKERVACSRAESIVRASSGSGCWSSDVRRTNRGWDVVVNEPRPDGVHTTTVHLSHTFEPLPS
jgi:transcriptional regulator with XRE-family HTH domain